MDKFAGLYRYLHNNPTQEIVLTFQDIERMIGQRLCQSAYNYDAYWNPSGHKNIANTIDECGYKIIEINRNAQYIKIRKN